jgi:hypothetical protein
MSDVPSWLNEENISTASKVAQNPAVQKAAKDPAVQKAAINAARNAPPPPPPPPKAQPAWTDPEVGKPVAEVVGAAPATTSTDGRASEFVIEEETLKEMQKWHLALRLSYMAATVLMCVAAVLTLQVQKDIGLVFFACYVFFFAVLICCFEFAMSVSVSSLFCFLSFFLIFHCFFLLVGFQDHCG